MKHRTQDSTYEKGRMSQEFLGDDRQDVGESSNNRLDGYAGEVEVGRWIMDRNKHITPNNHLSKHSLSLK